MRILAAVAAVDEFARKISDAYAFEGASIDLGRGVHDGTLERDAVVRLPLATTNRHGLIAGATGTGKTKTVQVLAEQLSAAGVSVFAADYKGDLSGLLEPAPADGPAAARMQDLGLPFEPSGFPVEFLSLGGLGSGVPVRASVTDFGPQLLAKVLGANETQEASLALALSLRRRARAAAGRPRRPARAPHLLRDRRGQGRPEGDRRRFRSDDRRAAAIARRARGRRRTRVLRRAAVRDLGLAAVGLDGHGIISCLELPAVQDKSKLFSTVLMWLLAELFEQLPEVGDLDRPKLVFFFDEAHLLFDEATEAFMDSVERTVRMIRSKGVGVYFVTQAPTDVPRSVLAQLGNRIQHALRAFTPEDADALRKTVRTYPTSEFYDLEKLLTEVGIGEAAVTLLSEKGVPTPVVHTRLRAPSSKMEPASGLEAAVQASPLQAKYGTRVDRESASELLAARVEKAADAAEQEPAPAPRSAAPRP